MMVIVGRLPQLTRHCGVLIVLATALSLMFPFAAFAQSARASFFLQMLRQNPDPRVRVSAALRLGGLREADTVEPLVEIFNAERDPTVLAAILSTFASIGDSRALDAVQTALRNPSPAVVSQARRALPSLRSGSASEMPGATPSGAGASARFLIGLGTVNNQGAGSDSQLQQVAQSAIQRALQQRREVILNSGPPAAAQRTLQTRNLHGHFFDANIQSIQPRGNGVRAAVSIAVSTYPGRVYEFESSTAITITGGSSDTTVVRQDAVRRAMESAVNRAVDQLSQAGP